MRAPPQPVALLLQSPEPHWRSRPLPTQVMIDGRTRWRLAPQFWLTLEAANAALVRTTAGDRTLIRLAPQARGRHQNVTLRRTHQPWIEGDSTVSERGAGRLYAQCRALGGGAMSERWSRPQLFGLHAANFDWHQQGDLLNQPLLETGERPPNVHLRWQLAPRLGLPRGPFTLWRRAGTRPRPTA